MQEFTIHGVILEKETGMPKILLHSPNRQICLALPVGPFEASAIIVELEGVQPPRPLTHDLLVEFFVRHKFELNYIEIYAQIGDQQLARIFYKRGIKRFSMETRPSDAIALAVRMDAPMMVHEDCVPALAFIEHSTGDEGELDYLFLENQMSGATIV